MVMHYSWRAYALRPTLRRDWRSRTGWTLMVSQLALLLIVNTLRANSTRAGRVCT